MIFNSTTFGLMSGRHATAVAAIAQNGKNILKVFTPPSNPQSLKQSKQRAKFALVNKQLSPMCGLYRVTFGNSSGLHYAVSDALKHAVIGTYPDYELDYPKLVFSKGNLFSTDQITAVKSTGNSIKVDWDATPESEYAQDSNANMVFMNAATQFCIVRQDLALRSAGTLTYDLPASFTASEVHCWIYFTSLDLTSASMSLYIGEVQL